MSIIKSFFGFNNQKRDFVLDYFKVQIEKQGMKIDSIDETELIYISKGDINLKVSLDNIRVVYEREYDKSVITGFVKSILNYSLEMPEQWSDVKERIFVSLFTSEYDYQDFINFEFSQKVNKIYTYRENDLFFWVTYENLKKWNISEKKLVEQAQQNGDRILSATKIVYDTIEDRKLGMLESPENENLKAALLLAPSMKERIVKDFSFPFYAVIPVRDFCYVFSEHDFEFFSQRIGQVVVEEYEQSAYPFTPELLRFSEVGVETVGIYSEL
ncbi:hypothetical protein [Maribacter litoralis]|uniref:hypothetical protein n=1 Tax=Maribacter litoralis TaxID=2059726 RepID=UPI000E31772C|nr:hypothetical protein [Maribacter litoralis]